YERIAAEEKGLCRLNTVGGRKFELDLFCLSVLERDLTLGVGRKVGRIQRPVEPCVACCEAEWQFTRFPRKCGLGNKLERFFVLRRRTVGVDRLFAIRRDVL